MEFKVKIPPQNVADSMQAYAQHPKLADAETFERCAKTIRKLQEQGEAANDRLALTYAFLNATGPRSLARENEYLPLFGSEVSCAYLERRARELREEVSHELSAKEFHYPGPVNGDSIADKGGALTSLHEVVGKFQRMAFEVEHAASQFLKAPEATRQDFLKVFFQRVRAFTQFGAGYGLDKPQPPTV